MKHYQLIGHVPQGHNNSKTERDYRRRAGRFGFVYIVYDLNHYLYKYQQGEAEDAAKELFTVFFNTDCQTATQAVNQIYVYASKTFMEAWNHEAALAMADEAQMLGE